MTPMGLPQLWGCSNLREYIKVEDHCTRAAGLVKWHWGHKAVHCSKSPNSSYTTIFYTTITHFVSCSLGASRWCARMQGQVAFWGTKSFPNHSSTTSQRTSTLSVSLRALDCQAEVETIGGKGPALLQKLARPRCESQTNA